SAWILWGHKAFLFFASLKLAVVIVLSLATIAAVGTFVEAKYNDAVMAKVVVYQSFWMYLIMGLLVINLVCSAVDRIPWKKRHIPFLLAHIGIIILIVGSYVTQRIGL